MHIFPRMYVLWGRMVSESSMTYYRTCRTYGKIVSSDIIISVESLFGSIRRAGTCSVKSCHRVRDKDQTSGGPKKFWYLSGIRLVFIWSLSGVLPVFYLSLAWTLDFTGQVPAPCRTENTFYHHLTSLSWVNSVGMDSKYYSLGGVTGSERGSSI